MNELDFQKLFPKILDDVRRHGEAVVETPSAVYVLKPEAVSRLKEYASALNKIPVVQLCRPHSTGCEDCVAERRRLLGAVISGFSAGDAAAGRASIGRLLSQNEDLPECDECLEEAKAALEPLLQLSPTLDVEDFSRVPVVSSFTKVAVRGAEVVDEYAVLLPEGQSFTVRILRERRTGRYWYDPVLPVETLSAEERDILRRVREAVGSAAAGSHEDLRAVWLRELERHGARGNLLKPVLEPYFEGLWDIQFLLYDRDHLTDIFIYPNGVVTVSTYERDMDCTLRLTRKGLERLAEGYRLATGQSFSRSHPMSICFWEEHNCRISALGYTANHPEKPDFAIRLWPEKPWHVLNLVVRKAIDTATAAVLTAGANLGAGMIFAGGPGSGKSTMLQTVLFMIPREWRKVAFLTAREIHSWFFEHRFRISEMRVHTSDEVTAEGVPIFRAVKQALVHGTAVWIFNEIKYRDEAGPFFTAAAAAGQSSVLTTMHAGSASDIVHRLHVDFKLPATVLRVIRWIPVLMLVRGAGAASKRRFLSELTEVIPFRRDPIEEEALRSIIRRRGRRWEFAGVGELTSSNAEDFVRESPFLVSAGETAGLDPFGVGELILLFRDVYDRILERGVPSPERMTSLMGALFAALSDETFTGEAGERQEVFERWVLRAKQVL